MILIIENDPAMRKSVRHAFYKIPLNTCGASHRYAEAVLQKFPVSAVYIPRIETIPNPIGFCRRFKEAHPELPLVAAAERGGSVDLDALYAVTDNIPLRPIATIRVVEILCELCRLYTGRDPADCRVGRALVLTPYAHIACCHCRWMTFTTHALSLLRHLAEAYPREVSSKELSLCTGSPLAKRTPSAVRTMISELNARVMRATGHPIVVRGATGYTVSIP